MKKIAALCCVAILLTLYAGSVFAASVPGPSQDFYVNDFAGVLTADTKLIIMRDSVALQQQTGAQIVVVTVTTLDGQALETYSLDILRSWGIGDKVKNNGVLILLAINERMSRIEVGYGLEGRLPDGKTGRIQDDYMLPYYKNDQYDEGIKNGYLAVLQEVAAEYDLDLSTIEQSVPEQPANNPMGDSSLPTLIGFGFIFLLLLADWIFLHGIITRTLIMSAFLRGRRYGGGKGGSGFGGGFGGGGGSGGGGSGGGGGSSRGF